MILKNKLSFKFIIIPLTFIFIISLTFLAGYYYIVNNNQFNSQKLSNKPFSNGPITTTPKSLRLNLDQPTDDFLSYTSSIIVSGQTSSNKDVLISTDDNDLVIKAKPDGSFSTVLNLEEGVNQITAVVFDADGKSQFIEKLVYYSKEKL